MNTQNTDSLINRGLFFNIRDINNELYSLFRRYSMAVNKLNGHDLFGNIPIKQTLDENGIGVKYSKGSITFRNGIDDIQYIIDNRNQIYRLLGAYSPQEIYNNRRNQSKVNEYLSKLHRFFDIGNFDDDMQMHISKIDGNDHDLNDIDYWADYIMNQTWVNNLAKASIMNLPDNKDYRIDYLVEDIHRQLSEHIDNYHKSIIEFDKSLYIDKGDTSTDKGDGRYIDALNKLNSFDKLSYCFYEMFKPIGGTNQKYLKVKMETNGTLDIQGVLGLSDCVHVPWEYGSPEYLRSLNTGNQRYEFKLSIPFNDFNSILWWKPDEKEELVEEEQNNPEGYTPPEEPQKKYRYYKAYETERFLRWFGSNYIPMLDKETIYKKTICSIPVLSNDVQSDKFYNDSNNLMNNPDMAKVNIDNSTSLSLLNLSPKSTIEIVNKEDGQYLQFVVSGHQQTSNISFHVQGKILPIIQEMNHYGHTLELYDDFYVKLTQSLILMELTRTLKPNIEEVWGIVSNNEAYIPDDWMQIKSQIERIIWTPTSVDLIRLRAIDSESIILKTIIDMTKRLTFIDNIKEYMEKFNPSFDISKIEQKIQGKDDFFYINELHEFIYNSQDSDNKHLLTKLNISDEIADVLKDTLNYLYSPRFNLTYETTVDELRNRIQTLNNLVVRLPVDTYANKVASLHIFQDWKKFVDESLKYLVENDELIKVDGQSGYGTDGIEHEFSEYYTSYLGDGNSDNIPFIDYSYCYDKDGNVIHDRWDFWSEDDFR